jgi:FMN phosphatase YigB (HAD superfamily)
LADWLGVPRHTFAAVFGGVIARGGDYRETFEFFRPGFELGIERRRREEAGCPENFGTEDLYPDADSALRQLRANGYMVGIAGNQTLRAEQLLRRLRLPADWIGTSASWGVEKPSPSFFTMVVQQCGCPPAQIAYVGDRLDNDVRPALAAGMSAVFIRRGPWGYLHSSDPDATQASFRIHSLSELPERLKHFVPEA